MEYVWRGSDRQGMNASAWHFFAAEVFIIMVSTPLISLTFEQKDLAPTLSEILEDMLFLLGDALWTEFPSIRKARLRCS